MSALSSPLPSLDALRRLLLTRLVFNLAAMLGLAQAGIVYWIVVVAIGVDDPWPLGWLAIAAGLGVFHALTVPAVTQARRRGDRLGALARFYIELGVAQLLVATAIAACWLGYAVLGAAAWAFGFDLAAVDALFRALSALAVGCVVAWTLWGFTRGQARIEVTQIRLPLPELHPTLDGLRLAHISDLHIGNGLEGARLDHMVDRTNATDPDVVVLTGDIFDFDPRHVDDGARRLGRLRARHGVYAILGNHDLYVGGELVAAALARYAPSLRLLRNEFLRLPVAEPLYLAGVEDPGGRLWHDRGLRVDAIDALARERPSDGPVVMLVHQPEAFAHAAEHGFPLVLCGHTHGGQLALPVARGQVNLARVMTRFTRGLYQLEQSILYVNRGLGVGGPALRIHCDREIAILELSPAD